MKIEYIHQFGPEKEPLKIFEDNEIPDNIKEIINTNKLFSSSKDFGSKGLGEPEEFETLRIIFKKEDVREFHYFNKAIHYFMNTTEELRPVFVVFTHFMTAIKNK